MILKPEQTTKGKEANKMARTTKARATRTARSKTRRSNNIFNDKRNRGVAIIAVLAMAICGLVGYAVAALSQDLEINGTAAVKGLNWDIHFANLSETAELSGKAEEKTHPAIDTNTTKIGDYDIVLNRPGDAVTYKFDVVNDGDIDAEITSVTIKTGAGLTCALASGETDTEGQAARICNNLNYTLTYDGDGTTVTVGDPLATAASRKMVLKLALSDTMEISDLPNTDISVSGLQVVITYDQKTE